jgi:hypothetical protein
VLAEEGVGRTRSEAVRHSTARLRRMACGVAVARVGSMERGRAGGSAAASRCGGPGGRGWRRSRDDEASQREGGDCSSPEKPAMSELDLASA